ncbi:hypothetical protein BpHYR1_035210 [Brachionus plicatilis]|uniref:Uncharacterized protein n=1 Tax=Brachionus plicatilis TaxID=10195 RepID=A0A3M7T9M2_BRAPC|nr:hypothetical protein BpHYR1_035210 [Brachionus plicatilis]
MLVDDQLFSIQRLHLKLLDDRGIHDYLKVRSLFVMSLWSINSNKSTQANQFPLGSNWRRNVHSRDRKFKAIISNVALLNSY